MDKKDYFVVDKKINDEIKKCTNWLVELKRFAAQTTGIKGLVGEVHKGIPFDIETIKDITTPGILVRDLVIQNDDSYSCKVYPLTQEARDLLESGNFELCGRIIVEMKDREYLHELAAIAASLSEVIDISVSRPITAVTFFTFDIRYKEPSNGS